MTTSKRPPNTIAPGSESVQDQRAAAHNKILKGLLDADDEKDNANNAFANKMNAPNQTPPQRMGNQRPMGDSKTDNPMLMDLLNHDDDNNMDGRSNQRNNNSNSNSELLRQLQKEDTPKDHHHNMNSMGNEELIQLLRFQGNDFSNRKRPSNESESDSPLAKRTEDKPSKLREKNKMLASLLSNPSKAPTSFTTIPVVTTIPDIPQSRKVPDAQRGFQVNCN